MRPSSRQPWHLPSSRQPCRIHDNITADVLKDGGEPIVQMFTNMLNRCLSEGKLPNSWENASVILIHKKGDTADIKKLQTDKLVTNHVQCILSGDPA